MADNFQEDLLEQVSKLLQYHNSLGIKEYPRTQFLERFLNKPVESSPSHPRAITRRSEKKVEKFSDKKHSFDPGLVRGQRRGRRLG